MAEEVSIPGENKKRPDVVLYVNGIALGLLELKRSSVSVSTVNFAFDRSQTPSIGVTNISDYFGAGKSSPASKSKEIRDLFNIGLMEPEWTLPSRMDSNPMAWTISVDGFIMDARYVPRYIQEVAFAKGLIPYIPADRQ